MKTLDKTERAILINKFMREPEKLSYEEALKKVNKHHDFLKELNKKLKNEGKTKEQIEEIFRKEFYKLCGN